MRPLWTCSCCCSASSKLVLLLHSSCIQSHVCTSTWLPRRADDVQVEFVMLDPYVRAPLQHDGNGVYSLRFKVRRSYCVGTCDAIYRILYWYIFC